MAKYQANSVITFSLLSLLLFYTVIRNANPEYLQYYFFILPLAVFCQLFYGISVQTQNFTPGKGLSDISGIFFNTGIWGGFISIVFIVTIGLIFYLDFKVQKIIKYILILFAIGFFILLIASNSRAAWLSSLMGLSFIFIRIFLRKSCYRRSKIKYLIINCVTVISLLFLFNTYNLKKDSANGRLLIWQISFNMVKESPLHGFGVEGFERNYMNYQADHFRSNSNMTYASLADDNYYAFNEFMRILTEQGVIGFLFILILIYYLLIKQPKYPKNNYVVFIFISKVAIWGLLTFSLFSYPLSIFQFNILLVFFVAVIALHQLPVKKISIDKNLQNKGTRKIIFVNSIISFLIILNFLFYSDKIKPYINAYKKWDEALKTFQFNKQASTDSMKNVYFILKNDHVFMITLGKALNRSADFNQAALILLETIKECPSFDAYVELGKSYEQMGEFEKAVDSWRQASLMIPSKFMPQYLLAKMQFKNGNFKEAHFISEALLKKDIKVYTPELQQMFEELRRISLMKDTIDQLIYY